MPALGRTWPVATPGLQGGPIDEPRVATGADGSSTPTTSRSSPRRATDGPGSTHKEGAPMITLTRLSGSVFVLNSDLIERIDCTPDSVVTLIDGKKYVVTESLEEIVAAVRAYRGEVVAVGSRLARRHHRGEDITQTAGADRPTLVPVAGTHGEG